MATKVINSDLEDGALELVNWLLSEPGEIRFYEEQKNVLVFMSHWDLEGYFNLIEKIEYEPWVDGTTKLEYNGHDYVVDVYYTLKNHNIDVAWFKQLHESKEE